MMAIDEREHHRPGLPGGPETACRVVSVFGPAGHAQAVQTGRTAANFQREPVGRPWRNPASPRFVNALSIDVEDWIQSAFDPSRPLTDCFRRNTEQVLAMLDESGVRATFFVLGLAARKCPELIRTIHAAGHEVQSHGFSHQAIARQTPRSFRADVEQAKKELEDLLGAPIRGYRAPAFGITKRTAWALDVLLDCGFVYDSSVFPVRMRRYGVAHLPAGPHLLRAPSGRAIQEIPVVAFRFFMRNWPVGGGGYLRLLPAGLIRRAIVQSNQSGVPATLYMHPYEIAPEEFKDLGQKISWSRRLHQGMGRRSFARKMAAILREFDFGALDDLVRAYPPASWPIADLGCTSHE